jgi:alcohol dehydrogenase class IV
MGAPGRPAWELVRELIAGLDLPVTLRAVGLKREDLDGLARSALDYRAVKVNPRPIAGARDVREILDLAW